MNTRRYPRTMQEAFPMTPEYADPFAGSFEGFTCRRSWLIPKVIAALGFLYLLASVLRTFH